MDKADLMQQLAHQQTPEPEIARAITNEIHPDTGVLMSHSPPSDG